MYDELIQSLRICSSWEGSCLGCKYYDAEENKCMGSKEKLLDEAANAIADMELEKDCLGEAAMALYGALPKWNPIQEVPELKVGDEGYNGYLVYANGYYEIADYTTDRFGNLEYFHVNGEYEPDVTHWMPLPDPPNEVDQEERNRELCRSNYAAQLEGLGYNADGTPKCSE